MNIQKTAGIAALLFATFLTTSSVFAISPNAEQRGRTPEVTNEMVKPSVTVNNRSCQARETAVKNRMNQLVMLVSSMEMTFDKIATRVETFYKDNVLPTGKSVSNYDSLVNDIAAKKDAVQKEVDKTKTDISNFSCTSNPRSLLNQFRIDMQAVKTALKVYRTSVRNLIVAVSSVSEESETTPTSTVSPAINEK